MKPRLAAILILIAAACYASPELTATFENYFALQTALANDDLKAAVDAAHKLENSVPAKGNDQRMNERFETIQSLAKTIGSSKSLDEARKQFGEMSVLMIALRKETGAQGNEYFCPMVKKSWMQKGNEVQNPYLGKQMQGCGEKKS